MVPAVSLQLRERLQAVINNHGMGLERQAEVLIHLFSFDMMNTIGITNDQVMGRAATELALQLLGGGHRLNPTNMHQVNQFSQLFFFTPNLQAPFQLFRLLWISLVFH